MNLLLAKYVNPSRILERLLGLAEDVVIHAPCAPTSPSAPFSEDSQG
jgi:hypothetical protein